ncbi:MAG: MerR family transcriptional regulator [Planctomycetota bacterium]|jgi:DNA-binding transcriptional MerR regulator
MEPRKADGSQAGTYRIGQVARAAGLSRQTLHQYELLGLIRPVRRTQGGHRVFAGSVFRRLDEIRALKKTRTLAEIRQEFSAREGRGPRRGRR